MQRAYTVNKYGLINGGLYSVPANRLEHLSRNPNISYISQDRPLASLLNNTAPAVNANIAWSQGWDGTGIGVAVIDSGVSNDKDFQVSGKSTSRISYSQAFYGGSKTYDEYGHGTHVAGIVAGSGANSTGSQYIYTFKGIAPNANLINLRALDQNGSGTDGTVISAIQEAIQLKSMYNIRVINLSLSLSAARSLRATNSLPFAKPSRRPGKRESWLSSRQEIQDAITRRAQTATPPLPPRATILTSSPWVQ